MGEKTQNDDLKWVKIIWKHAKRRVYSKKEKRTIYIVLFLFMWVVNTRFDLCWERRRVDQEEND